MLVSLSAKIEDGQLDCKQIFALLSGYLDLELPAGRCEEIRQHIAACEPCVAFVESLEKTVTLCRTHTVSEMPAALEAKALTELQAAYAAMLAAKKAGREGSGQVD